MSTARREAWPPPLHRGVAVVTDYLAETEPVIMAIDQVRQRIDLPVIVRSAGGRRGLRYQVIDGPTIAEHLPMLTSLYQQVQRDLEATYQAPLVPLADEVAVLNVNITPPNGEYRWHYDRNAVTAVLYLNEVSGGELEFCANYRLTSARLRRLGRLQRGLDRCLQSPPLLHTAGRPSLVRPAAGTLVMMRGDHCLHSVRPVTGTQDRLSVVMSFEYSGHQAAPNHALDNYLYSQRETGKADPNYVD